MPLVSRKDVGDVLFCFMPSIEYHSQFNLKETEIYLAYGSGGWEVQDEDTASGEGFGEGTTCVKRREKGEEGPELFLLQ